MEEEGRDRRREEDRMMEEEGTRKQEVGRRMGEERRRMGEEGRRMVEEEGRRMKEEGMRRKKEQDIFEKGFHVSELIWDSYGFLQIDMYVVILIHWVVFLFLVYQS